jgi:ribosomal protein S27AE
MHQPRLVCVHCGTHVILDTKLTPKVCGTCDSIELVPLDQEPTWYPMVHTSPERALVHWS